MIQLGMLDFDTSHCVEFTRRLNHVGIAEDQWVYGAKVVVACPGESSMAPERIPVYTKEMKELGVPIVARPEDMIGQVGGMMIESLQGSVHLEKARPFLTAGIPCFIDKPFTCSRTEAEEIVRLAAANRVPIFSASSLRYAPEIFQFLAEHDPSRFRSVFTWGPAWLMDGNPGLFHYGIHAVEALFTLMGPGCRQVACHHEPNWDTVGAHWHDGRISLMSGIRSGQPGYGCAVSIEKTYHFNISTSYIYRELLKKVVEMFETGKAPLDISVTVEIVAFLEAALQSSQAGGAFRVL